MSELSGGPGDDDYLDIVDGRLDAVLFPHPGVAFAWDHATAVIMITEAGGRSRGDDRLELPAARCRDR